MFLFSHVPPSLLISWALHPILNIFPVLLLTGCSHTNSAPLTWRAGTSGEWLSKSPCFLTNLPNSTMTYWKQNMNKERQVSLFSVNRVTIAIWIRKHEASKQTEAQKHRNLRVFWGGCQHCTCLDSPKGLYYMISDTVIGVHKVA